jgi:hypothetical protein
MGKELVTGFAAVSAADFRATFPKLPAAMRRKASTGTGESAVVRACLDYLAGIGVFAWRVNNVGIFRDNAYVFHGTPGVPDIIGILPGGRWLGVECKSAKGKQSPAQIGFQKRASGAGGLYLLTRSAAELAEQLGGRK